MADGVWNGLVISGHLGSIQNDATALFYRGQFYMLNLGYPEMYAGISFSTINNSPVDIFYNLLSRKPTSLDVG